MSVRHLLMLILMVYVSILNIMLVNSLFGKYLSKYEKGGEGGFKELTGLGVLGSSNQEFGRIKRGHKGRERESKLQKLKNANSITRVLSVLKMILRTCWALYPACLI